MKNANTATPSPGPGKSERRLALEELGADAANLAQLLDLAVDQGCSEGTGRPLGTLLWVSRDLAEALAGKLESIACTEGKS